MKHTLPKFSVFLLCLLLPFAADAGCAAYYCNDVYVDVLYTNNNSVGTVYVYTSGDESAMTGCTALGGTAFTFTLDTHGGRAVYATLLASVAAERPVYIVAVQGSAGCKISYVRYMRQ